MDTKQNRVIYENTFPVERKSLKVRKLENHQGEMVSVSEVSGNRHYAIQFPSIGIQDLIDTLIVARDTE